MLRRAATVRPFRVEDQAASRALIEQGLGEHFGFIDTDANPDLANIAASYSPPTRAFFIAEDDGKVVGTIGLVLETQRARVVRVAVAPTHRRLGVGSTLLEHAIEAATAMGIDELIAHTQPEWIAAVAFYRAHGFALFGRDEVDVHLRLRIRSP
jgi:ribosomal protein S18 acetylase RimI-like enzyme